jgi:hypothetical protein
LDASLLKLAETVKLSKTVKLICLPSTNKPYNNAIAVMSGWGNNAEDTSKLKLSSLNVIPTKECAAAYKLKTKHRIREDYHICAAKDLSYSTGCHGDSGG